MITLILVLFPAISALVVGLLKGDFAKQAALFASFIQLGLGVAAFSQCYASNGPGNEIYFTTEWIPVMGINFTLALDGVNVLLVLLTTILVPFILTAAANRDYFRPNMLGGLVLFMQAGLLGVFMARDAVAFYLFWEAALIPVYLIAAFYSGEARWPVFIKFFVYTIFGSLFMLVALVYLYFQVPGAHSSSLAAITEAGRSLPAETQGIVFLALFLAFAIKMPLFPFHTWQPDTYTEAAPTATMLLSGIMLKMGIYGAITWLLPVVPLGVEKYQNVVIILSIVGIVYGSIIAIMQNDMKRMVAYSSFAHVGLMCAGLFTLGAEALQGVIIQMFSHGLTVVGLFAVIDFIERRTGNRELSKLGGLTQLSASLTFYFMVLLFGSMALPLTSGFIGEFLLLKSVFGYNAIYGVVAGTTIILGAVYMLRLYQKSMFGALKMEEMRGNFAPLTVAEHLTLAPLVSLVLWVGIYPSSFMDISTKAASLVANSFMF